MESAEILDEIVCDLYPSDDEQIPVMAVLAKTEEQEAASLQQKHVLFGELADRVGAGILPLIANIIGFVVASKCFNLQFFSQIFFAHLLWKCSVLEIFPRSFCKII